MNPEDRIRELKQRFMDERDRARDFARRLDDAGTEIRVLESALRQEKARAEQAEKERDLLKDECHEMMNALGDWRARAEQAEKERDEARKAAYADGADAYLLRQQLDVEKADRERAEADNAALLERLRRLERVRELLRDGVSGGHIKLVDDCRELSEACAAAEALKS